MNLWLVTLAFRQFIHRSNILFGFIQFHLRVL